MKKIELSIKKERLSNEICRVNGAIKELVDLCATTEEIKVDEPLIWEFIGGLKMDILYDRYATEYILQITPKPLSSMEKMIRNDYFQKSPGGGQWDDTLRIIRNIDSQFEYETGSPLKLEESAGTWVVTKKLEKELMDSCTVELTPEQEHYASLMTAYRNAEKALKKFEVENGVKTYVGRLFLQTNSLECVFNSF